MEKINKHSYREIAKILGCSYNLVFLVVSGNLSGGKGKAKKVKDFLFEQGIDCKPFIPAYIRNCGLKSKRREIYSLIDRGFKKKYIAENLDASESAIYYWMKKWKKGE